MNNILTLLWSSEPIPADEVEIVSSEVYKNIILQEKDLLSVNIYTPSDMTQDLETPIAPMEVSLDCSRVAGHLI